MVVPGPSASGPAPRRLSRRRFLRLSGGLGGAAVLALVLDACGAGATATAPPAAAPAAAPSPTAAPAPSATAPSAPPTATTAPAATAPAATSAPTTAPAAPTVAAAAPTATTAAAPVEVQIYDFGFKPPTVTVPVGTTVKWVNTGIQHTTTSMDDLWDSGVLDTGATFTYTFTKAGTYAYQCTLHPEMKGMVVVQ
ncbi:MAG TPA: cupredoxin domain-containing protein [Thermomicrobiales bacterium]|nr:cupredoxin domain-containing protein [Thermomicrobiales bacterium]